MAKLQAASDYALYKSTHSLTHQAAAPWDRQTDGSRYSKCPPPRRGIIKQTEEARARRGTDVSKTHFCKTKLRRDDNKGGEGS